MSTKVEIYLPGQVVGPIRRGIASGEFVVTFELHPDGTPEEERRRVRTRGDLATWVANTNELGEGTPIIAVGHPYRAAGTPQVPTWMLDATRIAIDRAQVQR